MGDVPPDGPPRAEGPADLAAIGELGLRAAGAIVEQMLRLGQQVGVARFPVTLFGTPTSTDGAPSSASDPTSPLADPGRPDIRTLRADAERLIELYGDWTRTLLDGITDLAGGDHATPESLTPPAVAPGGTTSVTAYLHLLEGPLAIPGALHASDLTAHHRGVLLGTSVTFDPPLVGGTPSGDRIDVEVSVAVPSDCPPGRYVGHVLLEHAPEVSLPLEVEVLPS